MVQPLFGAVADRLDDRACGGLVVELDQHLVEHHVVEDLEAGVGEGVGEPASVVAAPVHQVGHALPAQLLRHVLCVFAKILAIADQNHSLGFGLSYGRLIFQQFVQSKLKRRTEVCAGFGNQAAVQSFYKQMDRALIIGERALNKSLGRKDDQSDPV